MRELLIVGTGGFIGSCCRYLLTKAMSGFLEPFPLGTLFSNLIAGFIVGVVIGLQEHSVTISPKAKLFITTGMMGGLSTFSTFSLETVQFFQGGKILLGMGNIFLNLTCSLTAVVLGMALAKRVAA